MQVTMKDIRKSNVCYKAWAKDVYVPAKMSLPEAQNTMDALSKQAQQEGVNDLEEWIESISRRNPGDERVQKYNKAEETIYAFPEQK